VGISGGGEELHNWENLPQWIKNEGHKAANESEKLFSGESEDMPAPSEECPGKKRNRIEAEPLYKNDQEHQKKKKK